MAEKKPPDPCESGACNRVCEYSLSIQMGLLFPLVERRTKSLMVGNY